MRGPRRAGVPADRGGRRPYTLTTAPDDALWFTAMNGDAARRITTDGVVAEIPLPGSAARPHALVGGCWFTEWAADRIG